MVVIKEVAKLFRVVITRFYQTIIGYHLLLHIQCLSKVSCLMCLSCVLFSFAIHLWCVFYNLIIAKQLLFSYRFIQNSILFVMIENSLDIHKQLYLIKPDPYHYVHVFHVHFISAKAIQDPLEFYADRLKTCFGGLGTNDNMLIRICVSRSEVCLYFTFFAFSRSYDPLNFSID